MVMLSVTVALALSSQAGASTATEVFEQAVAKMREVHPAPYRVVGREAFDRRVAELRASLASDASDAALAVAIWRANHLLCDGHSNLAIHPGTSPRDVRYPLRFTTLGGELRILAVRGLDEALLGARVVAVNGMPWNEARERLLPIAAGDNEYFAALFSCSRVLEYPKIAAEIGLTAADGSLPLEVETLAGEIRPVVIGQQDPAAGSWAELPLPSGRLAGLFWRDRVAPHWVTTIEEYDAVYAQYNQVNRGEPTTESFAAAITATLAESSADKLIVDVRRNGGGDNTRNTPVLHAILKSERINRPGHLFVLISPNTFSACMNFCGWLERETYAIFVGEPTGAGANMYGDATSFALDRPGWTLRVSTLPWQESFGNDGRLWIHPYVEARTTLVDALEDWDPVLEAALDFDDPALVTWLGSTPVRMHWAGTMQEPAVAARKTWPRR